VRRVFRQVYVGPTVLTHQNRHMRRDVASRGSTQNLLDIAEGGEVAQLVKCWEGYRKTTALEALQCHARLNPYSFACLQFVIGGFLLSGGDGEKEVSIIAFWHSFGRDPMGEVSKAVGS